MIRIVDNYLFTLYSKYDFFSTRLELVLRDGIGFCFLSLSKFLFLRSKNCNCDQVIENSAGRNFSCFVVVLGIIHYQIRLLQAGCVISVQYQFAQ